jgi:hypothetical protein
MERIDFVCTAHVTLPPGYYYKFVVDGNWISDPMNSLKVSDGGNEFNSILKAGDLPRPTRKNGGVPFPKSKVPRPILEADTGNLQIQLRSTM